MYYLLVPSKQVYPQPTTYKSFPWSIRWHTQNLLFLPKDLQNSVYLTVFSDQNIIALKITMYSIICMHLGETFNQLSHDVAYSNFV